MKVKDLNVKKNKEAVSKDLTTLLQKSRAGLVDLSDAQQQRAVDSAAGKAAAERSAQVLV